MKDPMRKPVATTTTKSPPLIHHLITLDTALSKSIHTLFHPIIPHFFHLLLEYSADFRFSFPVALSLFFTPIHRSFLISFTLGLLLDLILIGLIKYIIRRSRPHYNPNMKPAVSIDHFSFPSGHASRVFFVTAFLSFLDGLNPSNWLLLSVWIWALLTSFSRVLLGRHFVLDVLAGGCVGVLEAMFVLRFLRF